MKRTGFIGGSDVADIFNIEPYGCKLRLWYEKTGREADYPKDTYHLRRGRMLEPLAAHLYAEQEKRKVVRTTKEAIDGDYPFMAAHVDRLIQKDPRGVGILEIKCPSVRQFARYRKLGADQAHILQMQHYFKVLNLKWGAYAFFSAELADMFSFEVFRDEELIALIVAGEVAFWELVKRQEAPEKLPDGDRRCNACEYMTTCKQLTLADYEPLTVADASLVHITDPKLEAIVEEYWQAKRIMDDAEEYIDELRNRIREQLEQHGVSKAIVGQTKIYRNVLQTMRWDTKRLERHHPELIPEFKVPSKPSDRLTLYRIKS